MSRFRHLRVRCLESQARRVSDLERSATRTAMIDYPSISFVNNTLVVALVTLSIGCYSLGARSCEGPPRRLDYWTPVLNEIDLTNRITVKGGVGGNKEIGAITDQSRVRGAVGFFKRHPDGWRDSWNAGGAAV